MDWLRRELRYYADKPEWSCFETTLVAFGAVAASDGNWWPAVALWATATLNVWFRK